MYYPIPRPFASPRLRARIVIVLLIAFSVVALGSMLLSITEGLLSITEVKDPDQDPISFLLVLASWVLLAFQGLLYLTTAVFLMTFLYRAHENLPALGTSKNSLQYSSGWMVGSFFVPFVSLVVPYRAVKELWQCSLPVPELYPGVSGYLPDPPAFFAIWWFCWILANIGNNVLFRIDDKSDVPLPWLSAVVNVFEIAAAVCLILIVRSIDQRQAEGKAVLGLGTIAGPPLPPLPPLQNY